MHAGGTSATPAYDEERVYCSDRDGRVYALDKENGDTVWEYELKDGIATSGIVVGDSFIFGSSHKKLYLLDKKSGKVEGKRGVSGGLSAPPAFYKGYIYLLSNEGHAYALGK
jgi:outer membrane protein assembly factor BamB